MGELLESAYGALVGTGVILEEKISVDIELGERGLGEGDEFSILRNVTLDNHEIYAYREVRSHKLNSILFLHSLFSSSLQFEDFVPLLQDYRLVAVDFRGFGNSTYERNIDSLWNYVEDIKLFLQIKKMDDVIIVGNCLGGLIAKMFASRYPKTVQASVLIGSIGVQGGADLFANDILPNNIEDIQSTNIYKTLSQSSRNFSDAYQDVLWELLNINISPNKNINGIKGTNEISKIKAPVLVIHGSNDTFIPLSQARITYNILGNKQCSFKTIEEAGHFPWQKDINATVSTMKTFFTETVPIYLYENFYKNLNLNGNEQRRSSVFYSFSFVGFIVAVLTCAFGIRETFVNFQ